MGVVVEKNVKEEKQEVHKCDICDKSFVSNAGLKTHITRIHGAKTEEKEKWFSCDLCEGKFRIEGALENHIKLKHKTVEIIDKEGNGEETLKRNHSMSPKAERKRTKSDASHLTKQVNEKEEDLKLGKEELKHVKEELKHVKEQQSKKDKNKIMEDMAKVLEERDILKAKVKVLEEKEVKKGETREAVINLDEEEDEVEDALMDIETGTEEEVDEVADALRLLNMKEAGRKKALFQAQFKCRVCGEHYSTKNGLVKHMDDAHGRISPCPFCKVGFRNFAT